MKVYKNIFWLIISPEALFRAWQVFKSDKKNKPDVILFGHDIEKNIFELYRELKSGSYRHGPYTQFWIHDPKLRRINKALVRDRVLHHAIFNVLNPIFEPTFIPMSFSCRQNKGTHKGVVAAAQILRTVSRNNTRPCYALKCDIQKFFDSVDHRILFEIIQERVKDTETLDLLEEIIESYSSESGTNEREREREDFATFFSKRYTYRKPDLSDLCQHIHECV